MFAVGKAQVSRLMEYGAFISFETSEGIAHIYIIYIIYNIYIYNILYVMYNII